MDFLIGSSRPADFGSLLLGEGMLLRGIDTDALIGADDPQAALDVLAQDTACLIGALKEGCTLRCTPRMVDLTRGCRTPPADELLCAGWQVTLSGTLLEMTSGNLRMLLEGCSLCWVGTLGSGLLLIELPQASSTGGFHLRTLPGDPGEIAFTLTALLPRPDTNEPPVRIHRLKEAAHD